MTALFDQFSSCLDPIGDYATKNPHGLASVLFLLADLPEGTSLLLTERASHLRHHPGEVSFPGGKWEQGDEFPVQTALREACEEVALQGQSVSILGLLPSFPTRARVMVTPVVGGLQTKPELTANRDEVESLFWVPLDFFLQDKRLRTDVFRRGTTTVWAPAYEFEGKEIWGFTAGVIKIFLNRCLSAGLVRENHAPEKHWAARKND